MQWWRRLFAIGLVAGSLVLFWMYFQEPSVPSYSVVTRPAPPPTVVATVEPSGNAVATTEPTLEPSPTVPSPEQSTPDISSTTSDAVKLPVLGEHPMKIIIPAASIDKKLASGGLNSEGAINPPPATAMWFSDDSFGNVPPGQLGTGIIAGHVSYGGKTDVFSRLGEVSVGDEVRLVYPDGFLLELEVVVAEVISKDDLQDDSRLWDPQSKERRVVIVTCSDEKGFRSDGHRVANYVVIATPVER